MSLGLELAWLSGPRLCSLPRLGGTLSLAEVGEDLVLAGPVLNHEAVWRKDGTSVLVHLAHNQIIESWGGRVGLRTHIADTLCQGVFSRFHAYHFNVAKCPLPHSHLCYLSS